MENGGTQRTECGSAVELVVRSVGKAPCAAARRAVSKYVSWGFDVLVGSVAGRRGRVWSGHGNFTFHVLQRRLKSSKTSMGMSLYYVVAKANELVRPLQGDEHLLPSLLQIQRSMRSN